MNNLERLEEEKRRMLDRHRAERQAIDNRIAKEKEHIKRQKEAEKREKEQQAQQNNLANADAAYKDFVKASMTITEINKKLEDFLNS